MLILKDECLELTVALTVGDAEALVGFPRAGRKAEQLD